MNIEKEREAFSRWVLTHPDNRKITAYEENIMFDAWQAAKAQAVPEGFAVVPIEITPKQIEAYMKGKVFPASMGEHRKFVERLSKDYKAMIEAQEQSHE